jgi:hypothetical protein
MTETPSRSDDSASRGREGLPAHTTPTWEVELLISGVAVFAMLQLPGWLDDRFFELDPRLNLDWHVSLLFGYIYSKGGAMILAATFVLHLLMRAHWIALVGLDSIYPDGVRWDRLRMGRQQRDVTRANLGTIADAIERADNRATLVFAVGVYLTMQMVKMFVLVLVCAGLAFAIDHFARVDANWFVAIGLAVVILPMLLLWRFDKAFGEKLGKDGFASRALRIVFNFYARIGFGRGSAPGMLLMSSNAGSRRVYAIVFTISLGAVTVIMTGLVVARDTDRFGSFGFLSEAAPESPRTLLRQHYDDQRGDQRPGWVPFVQSQVIQDPYLRLTIPIHPALHDAAMRRRCPAAVGPSAAKSGPAQLDCFASLHPIELDGHPVKIAFDLGSDPRLKLPALVVMIDARSLANGRHELLVGEPDQPDGTRTPSDRIPFWR